MVTSSNVCALCLAKILSGANAFQINYIQELELKPC